MDNNILHELKIALERERDRIIGELRLIAKPNLRVPGDWNATYPKFEAEQVGANVDHEEQEDEIEEYEERLSAEASLESRLLQVSHALDRISARTYGTCRACKHPIPLMRLRANPAAEYDMEHEPDKL